ncbi:helix-turn-helix transcriptional regulator [Pseudidiomarina terrestris]|uniref:AraC family transcriptional regulator n=1 Tax=Pseudidiomarina terrestris TaxID=2820060 RepID=A0AAW7QYZ3_9GAMM|nr:MULTISPECIES: AraC family transcriptional regulator [unclassified Pseudidiomarina]MDN7123529.1 AraC family transcriptional regulator [Pseudidiomarina sp. 1APP75-32.1]MDN7126681.1 AraC family transcriptional regulator [Pseudidiomarina sp. 1APR75-33.1]MDN7128747.1 AraC family transcriptional regulator [Pseudidiomarina sp. 1APR75-15]MDN7134994.1 AraC family transcriptional regulator [Pseudidiomarina sp. 1ASP75-5]MDN7137665.1 AraC family transcriptional regulator [Pseudidiomarina sp. 1ASP75-14]
MSQPSSWPLPAGSSRIVLPLELIEHLARHPLSKHFYPVAYGHYLAARGHRVEREAHTDHLLIFCHRGCGHYRVHTDQGVQSGSLHTGQLLLLPAGLAHAYQADQDTPWSIYWTHFSGLEASHSMDILGLQPGQFVLKLENWQSLLPSVTDLLNLQHQRWQRQRAVRAATLFQNLMAQLPDLASQAQHTQDFDLLALERFMQDNSHRNLDLADIAQVAGLSRFHFAKKFKAVTGTSPMRYFNELKIKLACQQLDSSTDSVRTIAQSLGFDDPYYFSRLFKKVMGIAPSTYRDSHQQHL